MSFPAKQDILEAATRIAPFVHRTPVLTCSSLDAMTGKQLFFKCENLQKIGAFKIRGATNAVLQLPEADRARGIATHSSGNHAQAIALTARNHGIPAYIVMPSNSPAVKMAAVRGYGAEVILCEPTLEARETELDKVVARTGATFIPPYDDWRIVAGQATAAKELLEEQPELDVVLAPVGGGGLLSGTALSVAYFSDRAEVWAGEPAGADDAFRSLQQGTLIPSVQPNTLADGLLTSLGERTFAVIREHVRGIITVTDDEIIAAMRLIWERMKLVVEPSAVVPLAAVIQQPDRWPGKRIGIILSGGNVDLGKLAKNF